VGQGSPTPGAPAVESFTLIAQDIAPPAASVQVNGKLKVENAFVESSPSGTLLR
jgi:hypothetical protein